MIEQDPRRLGQLLNYMGSLGERMSKDMILMRQSLLPPWKDNWWSDADNWASTISTAKKEHYEIARAHQEGHLSASDYEEKMLALSLALSKFLRQRLEPKAIKRAKNYVAQQSRKDKLRSKRQQNHRIQVSDPVYMDLLILKERYSDEQKDELTWDDLFKQLMRNR